MIGDIAAGPVAEFNWGRLVAAWDNPKVAEFANNTDRVNRLAERAPGFVWRMGADEMFAAQQDPKGLFKGSSRAASTLSVWASLDHLLSFVHKTVHQRFLAKGHLWFEPETRPKLVIWPVAADHRPTMIEAQEKLSALETNGDSDAAFGMGYAPVQARMSQLGIKGIA